MPQAIPVTSAFVTQLGDFTVAGVMDGLRRMPMREGFVANAPLADVEAAFRDAMRPVDMIENPFTPLLLRTPDQLVLFDTGNGPQEEGAGFGLLLANLAAIGVAPDDIDLVVISHCHGDHIGGLRDASGTPLFPSARVAVPAAELDFWLDPAQAQAAAPMWAGNFGNVARIFADPQLPALDLMRYGDGDELVPGVTAVAAPGHTPGHMAFRIESGGETLLLVSDAAHLPWLFVRHPDWSLMFDMDPQAARETRQRLLAEAAEKGWRVAGYHWGLPNIGHLRRLGDGFGFVPLPWP